MTEDEQAEAAGKAVEAVMYMKHDTSMDAWGQLTTSPATTTTTKNPEIEDRSAHTAMACAHTPHTPQLLRDGR